MFLLNIGLMTNDNQPVSLPWLRSALTLTRVRIARSAVHQSSTEPTFAAELREPLNFYQREELARLLKQDCIAYYDSESGGMLAGPKPWGAFDADQFLLPSGGLLGDALRLAKMDDEAFVEALSTSNKRTSLSSLATVVNSIETADARRRAEAWRRADDIGHYIGLDRPAWNSPLENGDQS